jgi:hypothetical protein
VIVRILGEGQLEVPDAVCAELNDLDAKLEAAVERGDEDGFRSALADLLTRVRQVGSPADADLLKPSELIVPQPDATMDEVRKLLTDEGLISG